MTENVNESTKMTEKVNKSTVSHIAKSISETCATPLTSLLSDENFMKDCKKTIELCTKVEGWSMGWFTPSILPIVNCMSINLKLPEEIRKLNSCMILTPRGSGKSELIKRMLANSNPKHFQVLPKKVFESELVEKPKEYFHNKILIHDDLISLFKGTSTKQREQSTNFWTQILDGGYDRDRYPQLKDVRCLVIFGLATEMMEQFKKDLLSETFFDRVPPMKFVVSEQQKREILKFRSEKRNIFIGNLIKKPDIKLPLPDEITDRKKKVIGFPYDENLEKLIIDFAMELDMYEVQSYARSQDYIKVFMMSNALLNNRKSVTFSDLLLYSVVHPLFVQSGHDLGIEKSILNLFKTNPYISDKDLMQKTTFSKQTFYKYKKILKKKGLI